MLENPAQSAAAYTASWVSSTSSIPPDLKEEPDVRKLLKIPLLEIQLIKSAHGKEEYAILRERERKRHAIIFAS